MPNLSGLSAQLQTDATHNRAVLYACFEPEYSQKRYAYVWFVKEQFFFYPKIYHRPG